LSGNVFLSGNNQYLRGESCDALEIMVFDKAWGFSSKAKMRSSKAKMVLQQTNLLVKSLAYTILRIA